MGRGGTMAVMRIAVLGTGMVGRTLAGRLAELGHEVSMGTRDPEASRGRADLGGWLVEQPDVELATYPQAVAGADLVVNATNGSASVAALEPIGPSLPAGVVLLDVANPLDFSAGFPPTLTVKDTDSLAEQIQRALPGTRVVKALNTVNADVMVHPERLPEPTTLFVSGDDAAAKALVVQLLGELGHADVLDLGDLSTARGPEMYLALWVRAMSALGTASFSIRVVR